MSVSRGGILVVGATSPVGIAIADTLSTTYEVLGTHHQHPIHATVPFDLAEDDPGALPVDWAALRAVVVAGGITRLDLCARDPDGTSRVNVQGTLRVIEYALAHGVLPVFLSSDAVFSGELSDEGPQPKAESHIADPHTAYGRQKKAVENALHDSRAVVLRLSKLVSTRSEDGGFPRDVAAELRRAESVRAATDQFMNLTWTKDVARVVDFVISEGLTGLWHVAAEPARSRYAWTLALAEALGADSGLVAPCSLRDFDFAEPRARDCSLDGSRLQHRLPWGLRSGDALLTQIAAEA